GRLHNAEEGDRDRAEEVRHGEGCAQHAGQAAEEARNAEEEVSQQRTLELLASYREDLNLYARDCLTIRDKQGLVERFPGFNAAQLYVHKQLEAQLQRTGKVRALVLKGR